MSETRIQWLTIAVRDELADALKHARRGHHAYATDSIADAVVFFGRLEEALKARGDD